MGHHVGALAVIVFFGVDAADHRQVVHLLGRVRQQFADVHAGHGSGNRAERPAGVGARLGIPAFQLAQAAGHVNHQHALLLPGQFRTGRGTRKQTQPAGNGARASAD